jgi:hypothetical protein
MESELKRLFFIGISSSILPRKFYRRIPLTMGRITPCAARMESTITTRRQVYAAVDKFDIRGYQHPLLGRGPAQTKRSSHPCLPHWSRPSGAVRQYVKETDHV